MISLLPDGNQLFEAAGHIVLIMFPTDTPPGPSTTLYVGRLLFTMAADSVTELLSFKGNSTDICAALR